MSVSEPNDTSVTRETVTGVSPRPASLASTEVAAVSRAVAVPPSATVIASAFATGVASLTGVIVIETLASDVSPSLSVTR